VQARHPTPRDASSLELGRARRDDISAPDRDRSERAIVTAKDRRNTTAQEVTAVTRQPQPDTVRGRIEQELVDPLGALGLDLEEVELTPAGRRRILRIAVDGDSGVTLDEVADATREISRVLDETDVMGEQPYTLEVTSRGVDRPLTLPRHWRRNTDRLVRVTFNGGETVTGRITATSDEGATLEVESGVQEVSFDEVAKALVQIEFNRRVRAPEHHEEG
jgi:ribosome maturation factor RimP